MILDDVDRRFGEAGPTRDAIADAVQPDHRERALEVLASRESARNRFYRGD